MTIALIDESNVHNWEIIMDGPEGSPYVVRFDLLLSNLLNRVPSLTYL
jgi:hypothetical protein